MFNDKTLMFAEELAEQVSFSRLFHSSVLIGVDLTDNYVSPTIRCALTALIHLFRTTLRHKLSEAAIDWLLGE